MEFLFACSCLPFYYGSPMILYSGTCSPCTCNGNSLTCDSVTGQCLNCLNFTDGFNCEKCMDGWFGNASSHICSSENSFSWILYWYYVYFVFQSHDIVSKVT